MKKALNLILMYLITLLSGVIIGTVLYSFYLNVLNFIAGTEIQFFTKKELLNAFFYVAFCVLIFICPFISYYKIRHPGGIPQLIAFILLSFFTWAVAIPGVFGLTQKYIEKNDFIEEHVPLSKGYFRKADNKVYYFTKDFSDNGTGALKSTCLEIDTTENGFVKVVDVVDSPSLEVNEKALPYREVLVKDTFQKYDIPFSIKFKNLFFECNFHVQCGLMTFIGYLSFALVLCSVFALTNVFKWKMLNTLLIVCCTFVILILNSNISLLPFGNLETKFAGTGFIKFFSKFTTHPLMMFMNLLFALIFIVLGIVIYFVRRHKNKNAY